MTIDSLICPECDMQVWINLGELDNLSKADAEAFECVYCGHVFPMPGWEELGMDKPDLGFPDPTFKTPNEAAGIKEKA